MNTLFKNTKKIFNPLNKTFNLSQKFTYNLNKRFSSSIVGLNESQVQDNQVKSFFNIYIKKEICELSYINKIALIVFNLIFILFLFLL
jgi:hypothetical protein